MKVTAGRYGSRLGWRFPGVAVPALLALGIALTLLLIPGSAGAGGPNEFIVPIVLEDGRDAPGVAYPTSVPVPPQVQTEVEPTSVPVQQQVQGRGVLITQQTSTTLISNTGQSPLFTNVFDHDYAQAFTTGSHGKGYKLTSVNMFMSTSGAQPSYSLKIHEDSSGEPGGSLGTLSGGTSLSSTLSSVTFTAPGTGISLNATTTYWLVMDVSASNTNAIVSVVNTDNEDGSGAAGWTIADDRRVRAFGQTAGWDGIGNRPAEFRFAIVGYAETKAAPVDPLSQPPRDPIIVSYTNAQGTPESVENRAASAERDTLWDYFYDACQSQRSGTTVHDYSWRNADGHLMQARNGWKYVEVQNARGDVTHTRPQTLNECASHGMYLRQRTCANEDWRDRNPHLLDSWCPTYRTW